MHISIRLAEMADRDEIEAIVRAAYAPYVARLGQRLPGPILDDYCLRIERREIFLAVEMYGSSAAGLVVLIDESDALLLDNIAVLPSLAGRGIGRQLFLFAEQTARDRGFLRLRLYTNVVMSENIALYRRNGWKEIDRRLEAGHSRVYFEKFLGPAA